MILALREHEVLDRDRAKIYKMRTQNHLNPTLLAVLSSQVNWMRSVPSNKAQY